MSLVEIDRVEKSFQRGRGTRIHALNGVTATIEKGETLALIGESGSGKSTLGRAILRLLDIDAGAVRFNGVDLHRLDRNHMRALRSQIQVVFQEPFESLNPRMRIAEIVAEPLEVHYSSQAAAERAAKVLSTLERVGLSKDYLSRFPGELSGGQQQRVGIARAIVTDPTFVVLDEPTSSLDLSVRSQILRLLVDLQSTLGLTYLFISHDIQTVEFISHRIAVMYLGSIVEQGPTEEVLRTPRHPYTKALLSARMSTDPDTRLPSMVLSGDPVSPGQLPTGCAFFARCPVREPRCADSPVELAPVSEDHRVACIRVEDPEVMSLAVEITSDGSAA